jgi:ubiquinone/menaquinone biosynthesis C-methylase UbiE
MYDIDRAFARRFLVKKASKLLDVGSGTGDFIAGFDGGAIELHAVEIDAAAREACKRIHPSLQLYSELAAIPDDIQFDAVFFRGTLQYMPNLRWVADYCMRHVRSDGYLFVLATPNAESLLAELQREQWVLANNIEHRYWFTRTHLLSLFGEAFRIRGYDFPYLGTPYENYSADIIKVLAMIDDPGARNVRVPFFGSMMNVALERI